MKRRSNKWKSAVENRGKRKKFIENREKKLDILSFELFYSHTKTINEIFSLFFWQENSFTSEQQTGKILNLSLARDNNFRLFLQFSTRVFVMI